ncbi:MAG: DNA polymerase III subunit gamma/tau [Actinobacteria bacterium]|nr:DNA polymerase III subunit gamma/tau [Actinomycetota bacterium]
MAESTSLYRRHRPGSFGEVVGQQHVVRTLRNAVEGDKVHHAYLFVGSRGTGKTSMAKILARSLNCERGGPTVTPCGECESCRTIAAGTSIDVIEMDAASNRSVDDVRDLRERVAYAPAGGHWKVYILDEAHMLTKEAWNAFLKTLEEPPPRTVFVLATTEAHKVMPTIADRCQRFDFQRPSLEQISEVLRRVAAAESIEVEDGAVAMIARSASGSFRDALGTLDQLVAFGGSPVELDSVLEMLGAADAELLFEAVDAVAAEDPRGVLLGVERMARSGRDPSQFARDLLAHLRHLLITQTTGEVPASFVVTATDTERLRAQAGAIGAAALVRTIDELADALTAIREGDEARLAVEIALLKAARPDLDPSTEGLLRRVERLEHGLPVGGEGSPARDEALPARDGAVPDAGPVSGETSSALPAEDPSPSPPASDPVQTDEHSSDRAQPDGHDYERPPLEDEAPPPVAEAAEAGPGFRPESRPESPQVQAEPEGAPEAEVEPPSAGVAVADLDLGELARVWPSVLDELAKTAPALAATFEGARPVAMGETGPEIGFPADASFNKRKAEAPERRQAVAAAFEAVIGAALKPTYVTLDEEAPPPDVPAPGSEEIDEDAILQKVKSEFGAEEVG